MTYREGCHDTCYGPAWAAMTSAMASHGHNHVACRGSDMTDHNPWALP